jgi:hypothetical protein
MESYNLCFPFGEVNAAVFQNASIYHLKKRLKIQTKVFTPREFSGLYFHADQIVPIEVLPYREYGEISNYRFKEFKKKKIETWLNPQVPNYILQRIQQKLPPVIFHNLPIYFQSDYKHRKYLIKSGIYSECMRFSKKEGDTFLGTGTYKDISTGTLYKCNIHEEMSRNFTKLSDMIADGFVLKNSKIKSWETHVFDELQWNESQEGLYSSIQDFININESVAFIRTRNILGAASSHNTNIEELRVLIEELLKLGYAVLNTGTPTISLPIQSKKYKEVSHNFSIKLQMLLASKCKLRIMSEEAGLFTAWAATEMPLVLFGKEWSMQNLENPISLLAQRKSIGIQDIRLGQSISKQNIQQLLG